MEPVSYAFLTSQPHHIRNCVCWLTLALRIVVLGLLHEGHEPLLSGGRRSRRGCSMCCRRTCISGPFLAHMHEENSTRKIPQNTVN